MIQLPEDAPFTAEQRAWLEKFLTKTLAGASIPSAPSGPAVPATILWGSQTGNAEGLAKKLAKRLKKGNFEPEVHDMADYDRSKLAGEKNVLVITSTYGDGEPPDNAEDFYNWILSEEASKLEGVSFSVLALGDSSYPDYCKCGIDIDQRFEALGATRVFKRIDCDVDFDVEFKEWSEGVIAELAPEFQVVGDTATAIDQEEQGYSKTRPFPSDILSNYNLNTGGDKETHHIALSLEGSELSYEVGDALGLMPKNDPAVVDEILANLPFKTENSEVPLPDGREGDLRDALIEHYDIGTINKPLIQKWQERSGSPFLRSLVEADDRDAYEDFCWGRDLIDLVCDHPADFSDGEDFVGVLKKLQPRLYSIASSPNAHPGEVHLCVGIVRYDSHGRKRGGICTSYLADRSEGDKPGVYVHSNKAFRMPENPDTPIIMCGPGTGIAPFRAFLEERKHSGAKGGNWLLFGNPHEATDFLYQDELEGFVKDGTLQRLDVAWSRDQAEKVYVQHLMEQNGAEIWKWFSEGAAFYICGDASRMARDVDDALHKVAEVHGDMSKEEAEEFIKQLKKDKRYQRDVY